MRIVATLLSLFVGFLLFMTGARFLLLLFNANKSNEIVNWILAKSDFWVKPFFDIMANRDVGTDGFLEPASLIAFFVYLIAGGLVIGLIKSANAGFGGRHYWGSA
jgi:hypothetical protein